MSLLHDIPFGTGFIFSQRLSKVFFSRTVTALEQGIILLQELCWNKEDLLDKWETINLDQPKLALVINVAFLNAIYHTSVYKKQMIFREITHG